VTEYYGPYWSAIDEYGHDHSISSEKYEKWKKVWGNEKKVGIHRGSAAGFTKAITGGIFKCKWEGSIETLYPWSDVHTYKNKIRCSDSILKYKEPTESLIEKYPRPADTNNLSPIVGYGTKFAYDEQLALRRINAMMGKRYQIHNLMLVFQGQDRGVVDDVLSAWRGPNKNELVVFVGVDGRQIKWVEVHSWMDDTTIHAMLRDKIMADKILDINKYCKHLQDLVPKYWKRKEFAAFDYIDVEIHWGWFVGALGFSFVCCGVAFFIINRL